MLRFILACFIQKRKYFEIKNGKLTFLGITFMKCNVLRNVSSK